MAEIYKRRPKLLITLFIIVFVAILLIMGRARAVTYDVLVAASHETRAVEVNPAADVLDFGTLTPGTVARRTISVSNDTSGRVIVRTRLTGPAKRWFKSDDLWLNLSPRSKREVTIEVRVPRVTQFGVFEAKLRLWNWPTLF